MACNHNCKSCNENCNERKEDFKFKTNDKSNIKKIIGVMSGKGGVGKSFVTSILASKMASLGYSVGILDADITGPSIPHAFGLNEQIVGNKNEMYPAETKNNIKVVSVNLLVKDKTDPVVWRGPILGNAVKQFYEETVWGDIDYLFVDMPPGTSDVALTVYQSLPIDGVIIVTTPQDLVSMIVGKAVKMAQMMNVKIIGIIENMAYIKCPHCDELIYPYGESNLNDLCNTYHVIPLCSLPIIPTNTKSVDEGLVEEIKINDLDITVNEIEGL